MSHEPDDSEPQASGPDYLWDAKAPADPEVERLEHLLRPLGHDVARPAPVLPAPRQAWRRMAWVGAVAATLLAASLLGVSWLGRERSSAVEAPVGAPDPVLMALGPDLEVAERTWVETRETARELRLGALGELTLGADSRLEVRRLSAEETRLYLERGRLSALVSADAQPRFFQVDTPSTRCVDLGCRYTLEVDAAGDALVEVETGRVAFENDGREVLVPRGARCRATRAQGAGTPRFADASEGLGAAADVFDAARGADGARRRMLADGLLAVVRDRRDCLVAWHLLQDPDPEIARRAQARLLEVVGPLDTRVIDPRLVPGVSDRAAWRTALESSWW